MKKWRRQGKVLCLLFFISPTIHFKIAFAVICRYNEGRRLFFAGGGRVLLSDPNRTVFDR